MKKMVSVIAEADAGRKLKYYVRGTLGLSYAQYCALKRSGNLTRNGLETRANDILCTGDRIELVFCEAPDGKSVAAEPGPLNIVYCDEDLMIIDKSAPLACQCTPHQPSGTLENRLCAHFAANPDFVFRPINRLDKGTSGLMAAALHAHACALMQKQLHTNDFVREYLAVVEGVLTGAGRIDLPLRKDDGATMRRIVDIDNGRNAVTHYEALKNDGLRTLVRLRLETGRTHQIRVHMAALGHPVTGDFLYGTECEQLPGRFALHSARIGLRHPLSGKFIEFQSELPNALKGLLNV